MDGAAFFLWAGQEQRSVGRGGKGQAKAEICGTLTTIPTKKEEREPQKEYYKTQKLRTLFHSSSLFRPLALLISSHFLSVSPFPQNPFPWFHQSVLPWSEAYIASSPSQDILHQIVMKYWQDFHVARNVYWGYLFITFCCNHMFLPLACSFMLGRLTYSSPNKY